MPARTSYRLSFPELHGHLVDVEARFAALAGAAALELQMAAWTPGSYLIREHGRHVQDVTAVDGDGRALVVTKVAKATWRVAASGAAEVVVRYRVYGYDLTVRTNHIDSSHAFLNGASTYLWAAERQAEPVDVVVDAPAGWKVVTGLPGADGRYQAADLDELIDAPTHVGPAPVLTGTAAGRPLALAVWGRPEAQAATLAQLLADASAIADGYAGIFGGVPYERYAFILMLAPDARGGLEHASSSALLASPFAFSSRKKYEELLELVSHEYFHLWNVKRIRPAALAPLAYDRECYTRSLWLAEGVTSYYDRHLLRRVGLLPAKRYLEKLADDWARYQGIPGRFKQSLEEASLDAWIKLYRPDENTINSTVSYYLKGSLAALCLDLEIRRRTAGRRSLDDALRRLWNEYGRKDRGYADADVQRELEAAVDLDLGVFFDRHVRGREDPDLAGELRAVGLELRPKWERPAEDADRPPAWLGLNPRTDGGRLIVSQVIAGGPGARAGLYAGDELVAIDGFRVDERGLADRVSARRPGDRARVTVFRRDELAELEVELGAKPHDAFDIVPLAEAGETERALGLGWLGEDPRAATADRGASEKAPIA